MDSAEGAVAAAEQHLRQGEPLLAYNAAQQGLERWPGHARLRQLQALALARSGDVQRANHILAELAAQGMDDAETLGMLARTHKDLALTEAGAGRRAHLQAGFDLYERAYRAAGSRGERDAAGYTGINAATMAMLLQDLPRARTIAAEVREILRGDDTAADYWREATLGEAALILGDAAAAAEHYTRAARLAGRRYGDIATTRRQARVIEGLLPRAAHAASDALAIPPVVAFTGHMIDQAGRPDPRFPANLEGAVRAAVHERLARIAPAAVYGSAACGADILCLEAARELGCETHVVLPFPAEAFRETSVAFAGGDWNARFDRVLADADSVTIASDHRASGSSATFEYANLLVTGMARLRAALLETSVRGLAVRDGAAPVRTGGTADMVSQWRRSGMEVDLVDLGSMRARSTPAEAVTASAAHPAAESATRHEIRAMLFADAVGYSKFTEDQIPIYVARFLGAIAGLAQRSPHRHEHVEVAGDGLYMVFANPADAGRFALELSALVAGTSWADHGLPANLNVRIALHCGPVHCLQDPLTGSPMYTGPHTSRTARIEPITPPGQVYASTAFAAVAAASGSPLALSYVGRIPLAKGYGSLGLYHVRGALG